jgi:hypothetical protein
MRRLLAFLGLEDRTGHVLLLLLSLPPLLAQLALPVPRLDADAVEYYSHLRSLYFDHDVDLANEFDHFGILSRYDKIRPTPTGHRRTIFSVGPALLWLPFYALGDGVAHALGQVEDGYSPFHIRAVCLGSLCYGLLGLLLLRRVLSELCGDEVAAWTLLLLLYASFLWWYLVDEPVMSHAGSFFLSALVLRVFWDGRHGLRVGRALVLGALVGLAATVRWQNALLLLLPAAGLLPLLRRDPRKAVSTGALVLFCFLLGVLPQMLAWKAIFGSYLLADPPHGRDFLRLFHPFLLQTLFSSRHGLLFWTPLLWGGFLGYLLFLRKSPWSAVTLAVPLALMTWVNACSGDWWAGGSFSNRRFDSCLPLLALGLALSLRALVALTARRPGLVLWAGLVVLVTWNLLFMQQYRENRIPRDGTVAFPRVVENSADILSSLVGSPPAWPANWLFALEQGLPPQKFDQMLGKYLFYRQNNLDGVIDMGDDRADPALLAEGFSSRVPCESGVCREVLGRARLFAPLDVAEALDVTVRASGSGSLGVGVNGRRVAELPLGPALTDLRFRVDAFGWHRELNEIALSVSPGGTARVDLLRFERPDRRR